MGASGNDAEVVSQAQADDGRPVGELIAAYRRGPGLLRASIEEMTREQLLAYPVPGKMSTQEVVCHVVDADQFLADRMKRTIATELPLLVGVNGILYLEALHYAERDLALDFALIEATRTQMAADLERLESDAWSRTAIHTETGLVTLRGLLLHAIRHVERHVDAIHEKRQPQYGAEGGHRNATLSHLALASMKLGRPIKWDPATETVVGDAEAKALLAPKPLRAPWNQS